MPIFTICAAFEGSILNSLLSETGIVAKVVLVVLLLFSLLSWTIILGKWGVFRKSRRQSSRFIKAFRHVNQFQEMVPVAGQYRPSPLVGVYEGAVAEIRRGAGSTRLSSVQRATQIAASEELTKMESRLPWLATTASATPFIGLFGTVWGIIDAFHGLGNAGSATLRAVAPGISEALITTAAGLFAAIPALIAYNIFSSEIRQFGARMDDFALELLNTIEREIDKAARGTR
jgi:biopolymer transport protein TolQ